MVRASKIVKVSPVEEEDMSKSKKGKKWEVDLKELDVDHKDVVEEKKKKEPAVGLFALWRFATGFELFLVFCGVILSTGVGALVPVQILVFGGLVSDIQPVLANPSEDALLNALLPTIKIIVYLGAAMLVGGYLTQMLWVLTGENQTRRIRQLYVHSILRQDMAWFDAAEEGSLTTRLSADTQFVQDAISEKAGATVQNLAQFITGFVIAFVKGWRLALVLFATLPVMAGVGGVMISILTKLTKKSQDSYADAGAVAEQAIAGIRTVNSFSLHARFQRRYEELLVVAERFQRTSGIVIGWGFGTFFLVLFGCYGLAFWYGSKLVIDGVGGADSGNILTTFLCIIMGAMALIMVPPNLSAFAAGRAAAFRIFLTIDRVPPIDSQSKEGKVLPKIAGKIQFKNVKFSYPTRPDTTILHNLSLDIKPGMTVAFVGPSGSGKSTSVGLVQRFYDPLSGSVMIDDVDIKELNVKWIRQQIGIVSQEPVLFNMSIKENILMGFEKEVYGSTGQATERSIPTDEEIIAVCKKANCHNFITQLPKGYDTAVGEHGGMLSGGQKQRIAIARALLKNPKILLLDEATSALDTASERLVQQALDIAAKDRTTIVIAHRLSTIRYADLIVVMDKGNLVEQGNHDQLYALGGVYTELVNKQKIKMKEDSSYVDDVSDKAEIEKALKEEKVNFVTQSVDKDGNKSTTITMEETPMNSPTSARKAEEEKLQRIQSARAPIFRVLRMMRPEIPLLVAGCFGAVLAGSVFPIYGFIFSKVVARLNYPADQIAPGPMEGTNLYAFLMIVLGVGACIAFGTQVTGFELAGARFTARMRALAFKALLRQEIGYFDQPGHSLGALTAALATDASGVNEMVTKVWGDVIQLFSSGMTGIIISFIYSWQLTLVLIGCVPFIALATALESRVHQGFEDKTKKAYQESGEIAAESFREVRTVVSLTKESYFEERYAKNIEGPHKLALRKAYVASLGYGTHQGFNMWTTATGFYAGVRFIGKGWINFEEMFVVILVMMITAGTVGRTSLFVSKFAKAKHCAINTFELLDRKTAIDPEQDGEPADDIKGNVQFKDITFRYPARPDIPIFSGEFNLGIKKRQTVALVGPSGCGKSTTIGMLQRWYDPLDGRVDVDRKYINNYSLKSLRKQMAIVQQEPVLFDLTIRQNILYGTERTDVPQEELEEMCRKANILTFIESLPDKFETRVGDKGSQLSGGQKQRIAIARALIRKPKILLLDEATSALDSESEKLVQEALDRTIEGKTTTTITIAHRLSTIQNADLICVIKNGKVVESGKHFELLELKGIYKDLVDQQDLSALQ